MVDIENTDEPKGRNHPEVKKKEQELIKKFPALGWTGKQIRAIHNKYLNAVAVVNEQHAVIEEGKGVLENKFPGIKLNEERIWLKILGDIPVDTIIKLTEEELAKLVHNYAENKHAMFQQTSVKPSANAIQVESPDEAKGIEQFHDIMNSYTALKFITVEQTLRELKFVEQWKNNNDKKSLCILIYHLDSKSYFSKLGKNEQIRLNKARSFFEGRYGIDLQHSFRKYSGISQEQFKNIVPTLRS